MTVSYIVSPGWWVIVFELPLFVIFIWIYYPIITRRDPSTESIRGGDIFFLSFNYMFLQGIIFGPFGIYALAGFNFFLIVVALLLTPVNGIEFPWVTWQKQHADTRPIPNPKTYYPKTSGYNITMHDIDNMSINGKEFEEFLKILFENMGYSVQLTRHSRDFGADLILSKQGQKISDQAKNSASSIGNDAVQQVYGSLSVYQTQKGIVVTNNYFTKHATHHASYTHTELWDRDKLEAMLSQYPVYK